MTELERVNYWAGHLLDWLRPNVERAEIVGSVRRGKENPKDIEILAQCPLKAEASLFGDTTLTLDTTTLDEWQAMQIEERTIALDEDVKRNGPRYRRFKMGERCTGVAGMVFELFVADRRNWGNQMVIRTGPAEYSHRLVTKRSMGGFMPNNLQQRDGYLWEGDRLIECPVEEDFFLEIGVPWIKPEERG